MFIPQGLISYIFPPKFCLFHFSLSHFCIFTLYANFPIKECCSTVFFFLLFTLGLRTHRHTSSRHYVAGICNITWKSFENGSALCFGATNEFHAVLADFDHFGVLKLFGEGQGSEVTHTGDLRRQQASGNVPRQKHSSFSQRQDLSPVTSLIFHV